MEKYAYTYSDTEPHKYQSKVKRDVDERASKRLGKTIWFMPGNATELEPLPEKEGYDVVFNKETHHWDYKEIKKEEEPKPYEPTELDKKREELWEIESWFDKHDYIGNKIATGRATIADYAKEIAQMNEYAAKKEQILKEIELLEKINS